MLEPIPTAAAADGHTRSQTGAREAGLRAEIAFWSEMLETCGDATTPESRERMGFALALAEKRLETLVEEFGSPGKTGEGRQNVFHLDRRRS